MYMGHGIYMDAPAAEDGGCHTIGLCVGIS